ncbi:MAG: chemotaxis protein CheW [Gammaproteobacteria bacterium]
MNAVVQMAAPAGGEEMADEQQQYLTFALGDEVFALGILNVKEILEFSGVTPIPMMPPVVAGGINLRGRVVPVVDLSVRFGRPPIVASRRTCVIIIEVGPAGAGQDVGVIVDAVHHVVEIPAPEIEPLPAFGARLRADFIAGMARTDGRFMVILDAGRVLEIDELAEMVRERAGEAAP